MNFSRLLLLKFLVGFYFFSKKIHQQEFDKNFQTCKKAKNADSAILAFSMHETPVRMNVNISSASLTWRAALQKCCRLGLVWSLQFLQFDLYNFQTRWDNIWHFMGLTNTLERFKNLKSQAKYQQYDHEMSENEQEHLKNNLIFVRPLKTFKQYKDQLYLGSPKRNTSSNCRKKCIFFCIKSGFDCCFDDFT